MKHPMNQAVRSSLGAPRCRAFTLIELIIVIALTAVLFGLLLVPLVSAIRYTQQAQIVTAAQDAARSTRERLTRELGSALFVFDGTSHPFVTTNPVVSGDDRYTNFLDLEIPGLDATGNYKSTIAHAYACKLDFAQPKAVSVPDKTDAQGNVITPGTQTDPTTGEPISYRPTQNGSAIISDPALVFPLAAGTTVTRYWVGLKDPSQPYNNTREGKFNSNTDNTYILYRAQFQPYVTVIDPSTRKIVIDPKTGKPELGPNTMLFATVTKTDANGNTKTVPEMDDPDFFRYVKPTDVNWLNDAHGAYGTQDAIGTTGTPGSAAQHNNRVEKWRSIAKPVIPGPNIDLILLPHNTDNTLNYDKGLGGPCTANGCPGIAHSGIAHDPVAGGYYPIVNTSVTFRPGTVSGDAVPGTTSDYNSQGLPTLDNSTGYGYVPTVYTATSQSWALPYHVTLYPGNYNGTQEYYDTQIASGTFSDGANVLINPGDLLEYRHTNSSDTTGTLVYNISLGYPLTDVGNNTYKLGGTDFVPLAVNPDTGTLNFGTPSLPNGPTDRNQRNWKYGVLDTSTPATRNLGGVDTAEGMTKGTIDLTKPVSSLASIKDSPLAPLDNTTGVKDAHIAPGGIRVTGPDTTAGPNHGQVVPYTEFNKNSNNPLQTAPLGNQYSVDYSLNTVQVSSDATTLIQDKTLPSSSQQITAVYDYQANMTRTDPAGATANPPKSLLDDPYLPMQVKVDYQTRDLIDVSIGVRIYDISNNRAQVIPAETKIKIGNSNRG